MYKTTINKLSSNKSSCKDSIIGDLMIMTDGQPYEGHIILHSYDEIIDLTEPRNVWGLGANFNVRYLKPGESVTLIVGEH